MSIEIRKKEKLQQLKQWAYLSTHPLNRFNSFCYDDDDEEPDNSLSIGDEHLDTISATKSDEFIKSSVENLILIPSESEALNANPTPSSDFKTKSSSTSLNSLLGETNTFDNSLLEFEISALMWKRLVVAVPLLILIFSSRI
nr:hypothetical protein [Tanacetum cinerariifolium]